ncbi:neogenin-like [Pectinophora gossypiella]|uniref:neogenin-like n=1 Tax=Pectinophora gossypiella TaxID=13191 RepID=UPI00214F12A1|nr:neogenin-like [Pectinophora gossypiella]
MRLFKNFIKILVILRCLNAQNVDYEIDAVVGHSAELPCNVTAETEGDKLSILAWYNTTLAAMLNSSSAFYSRDLRSDDYGESGSTSSDDDTDGRYQLIAHEEDGLNNLLIHSVRPSDAGLYYCLADFATSPSHKTFVQLNVIQPPQHLWVIHENGTRLVTASAGSNASENIGPYYVGDKVYLFCVAFGGKPLANLTWWAQNRPLKDTSTPISEHRVRSDIEYGPLTREDHGSMLSCTAANHGGPSDLAIDVIIDMYLPPELISIRDMTAATDGTTTAGRAYAGQQLRLQCRVFGALPTPEIQWRLNDDALDLQQNITIPEPSQRLVVSEVVLPITEEHDEARITCCAPANQRDEEALLCPQAMPLTVLYKPILQILVDGEMENETLCVVKGSNLALNCTHRANPAVYQIEWFHEDDIINLDEDEDLPMQPVLELKNVTEADAGEYVCAGRNDVDTTYSEPIVIQVTYPAYCEDVDIAEYGLGEGESINITCKVKSNPEPLAYRWVMVNEATDADTFRPTQPHTATQTDDATLQYQRPNGTAFNTIFCWGLNGVMEMGLPHTPCTFLVTDETVPRPPTDCKAVKGALGEISVQCEEGHNGGLPQKFKFSVYTVDTDKEIVSIISLEPKFIIQEPKEDNYRFVIIATNDKGNSICVEIDKENIIDETKEDTTPKNAVTNITTLALSLCGGVALVALAACGLVLCAHDRGSRIDLPRALSDPPLCAYNTEESNCETYHDSDDGSDCNVRRTESFRRAMSRYPSSKNYDVRRTSSFHSARYMNDMAEQEVAKCSDMLRHNPGCRVHSLQNISRKREMEAACDHLIMHLPPETNYHVAKPMNTFYTMPRKQRSRKHISDDASEITQTSDGFSLPPPPDEFGTYRAATRIKDIPAKSTPTYTTIKKSPKEPPKQYNDVIISPMNTVGLPTISGHPNSVYSYPDNDHHVSTNPFDDSP